MSGNPYSTHSPAQPHYIYSSPTRSHHPHPPHDQYPPPQTPPGYASSGPIRSPHLGHPPSPLMTALPSINGARPPQDLSPQYQINGSPQYPTHRSYSGSYAASNPSSGHYRQTPPSHAHPSSHHDMIRQSPSRENGDSALQSANKPWPMRPPPVTEQHAPVEDKPARTADPMSFASILSEPAGEPSKKASSSTVNQARTSFEPNRISSPVPRSSPAQSEKAPTQLKSEPNDQIIPSGLIPVSQHLQENKAKEWNALKEEFSYSSSKTDDMARPTAEKSSRVGVNGASPAKTTAPKKPRKTLTDKENEKIRKEMERVDAMEHSDLDDPEFDSAKVEYEQRGIKRKRDAEEQGQQRRKRRFTDMIDVLEKPLDGLAAIGENFHERKHADAALAEVDAEHVQAEKNRKKDQQRKRRREIGLKAEQEKKQAAEQKAKKAMDAAEREKYLREAEKSLKKIRHIKRMLDGEDDPEEISEVTPLAPNLEGGTTGSFHVGKQMSLEPPAKKQKLGPVTRPKKSKEQKQAEKDTAEAAWAAMQADEPVAIAPKGDPRKEALKKGSKRSESKEASPAIGTTSYTSSGYLQIYDQIWKDAAKKDIPKVHRIRDNSLQQKQSNLRKTCQLAGKEARRFQLRTNKSTKEDQARAKRAMREMMTFWKRNEREERDLRRMAEKQELENAKKAEQERENNRQKRKLNFLISQTELYSHFIGRKIKTDEVERSTDDATVAASAEKVQNSRSAHTVQLPDNLTKVGTKVTNFEDLDFDAEDDETLRQAAMANAQNAVQEAQDRARAFNGEDTQAAFDDDEGELNFQNPTSLGDVDISQPKMLNAQLKEYQLKGLNWLVNLYEQGINGILADEMGLGKTIQSISVMAYLAEHHNIWGPFLVIAPASTLHNWQQEITRFVPNIKVLPYWGTAKDRKVLRKFWDRKHITYTRDSQFHVLVTSYQLVVHDTQYFQKVKWQYMILDEAQAIKSSQSSRWKNLLAFHCRNRLLLTGTPIQNNMQELWALLHFIMPTLFDSHEEFSDWFSKDIESHAQSNTKLNEDQLKRLHMILKPFMLRRVKKHVQKELGDKVEKDVFCDLTYRQRAYYSNLRNRISIMDIIEKAAVGDDGDASTLMNLVMQFRKVCNHPDLFERAETTSPFAMAHWAECVSFLREGNNVNIGYSTRSLIQYDLPRILCSSEGRIDVPGPNNQRAGFEMKCLQHMMNIWTPENIKYSLERNEAFSWLRFADTSPNEVYHASHNGVFERAVSLKTKPNRLSSLQMIYDEEGDENFTPAHALFNIVERNDRKPLADMTSEGHMKNLLNVSRNAWDDAGFSSIEPCAQRAASAPPIQISCSDQSSIAERENAIFNVHARQALYGMPEKFEEALLEKKVDPILFPTTQILPEPTSAKGRYTNISVPSMRRFVTDSGKLGKLDQLLHELKNGGHRVLLYFQMTKMIDLIEEYLTYRNYKYLRLDGSTKLEDRRDYVHDFQTRDEIFIFLLSTRAGGLGINLTAADTVIFYDSDWNPTIDSQAMDRAHRLGQTKQVTVYRMITRGTIEERIRKRALQKEEVQRVVISGGSSGGVDFNTRSRENRTKDIAMWLADDDQAELIEQKEKEMAEKGEEPKKGRKSALKKRKDVTLDDMYHEGEGHFDDQSNKPSGAATPVSAVEVPAKGKKGPRGGKGTSKRAKTMKERLRVVDADGDLGMSGV